MRSLGSEVTCSCRSTRGGKGDNHIVLRCLAHRGHEVVRIIGIGFCHRNVGDADGCCVVVGNGTRSGGIADGRNPCTYQVGQPNGIGLGWLCNIVIEDRNLNRFGRT